MKKILATFAALACAGLLCSPAAAQAQPRVKKHPKQPPAAVKSAARSKVMTRPISRVILKREIVTGRRQIPRATVQITKLAMTHKLTKARRRVFVSKIGRRIHQKPF